MLFHKIHDRKGEEESMGKANHSHANHLKANMAGHSQIKADCGIKSIIPDNPACPELQREQMDRKY